MKMSIPRFFVREDDGKYDTLNTKLKYKRELK
ncbi:hypothetical protein P799_16210 [Lysinibacillus sphaericus CBAM5]|uniref:Uncharacterized protein n=1 Tax=Lysinibacillus sphaericus CBAM5 TaxID=1400869 RepID=W7S1T0_LYSSH|nr:hypothetical protein P799_16210 [Lysinibacillus sphaericus CBAM5]